MSTKTNTDEQARHYIAVTADRTQRDVIWGIGHTDEEAIRDAQSWRETNSADEVDSDGVALAPDLVAIECSSALYAEIKRVGWAGQRWTDVGTNGVATLDSELS